MYHIPVTYNIRETQDREIQKNIVKKIAMEMYVFLIIYKPEDSTIFDLLLEKVSFKSQKRCFKQSRLKTK